MDATTDVHLYQADEVMTYNESVNHNLVEDENGWTGIDELYNHWDEIDWNKSTMHNLNKTTRIPEIRPTRIACRIISLL